MKTLIKDMVRNLSRGQSRTLTSFNEKRSVDISHGSNGMYYVDIHWTSDYGLEQTAKLYEGVASDALVDVVSDYLG